ncbi:26S proteasome regulatory complex, subunit RPN7/PSMD6 [Trachipleistophora hominis]|uniref:26S proteasome regulatory complex, subunit RPN7/PSMD6 n=1 Tax=Trachipleistophora hominis TaxID=72359 RepID=L7JZE9_TRAHO|nr:26S proteasome regulatory complex, subunit RPN7/PSMD6 [Trachipleistophora hominis]
MESEFKEPTLVILEKIKKSKEGDHTELKNYLIENEMGHMYHTLCNKHVLPDEPEVYLPILKKNEEMLQKISEQQTEDDGKSIKKERLEYLAKIGNLSSFVEESRDAVLTTSTKMDIVLCQIRLGMIFKDYSLIHDKINAGLKLSEKDCDWDRKNKFKVYYAFYNLLKSDYELAADLFASSLATFQCNELFSYEMAVNYTIFCSLLSFSREQLHERVLKSTDVLEVKHHVNLAYDLAQAIYNCYYDKIFPCLVAFSSYYMDDIFIGDKIHYFINETKIRSYNQLLESYSSIGLESMALTFGVSEEYLEADLGKFLVNERMKCVIDKIDKMVLVKEVDETLYDMVGDKCEKIVNYIEREVNK